MGDLLTLQRTTPSQADFHQAMVLAWNTYMPDFPCNVMVAACLFGQYAFETGWGKSCWRWNLGNHRTGLLDPPHPGGWSGDYVELRTADEYIDGKRVIVGGYFRAYLNLQDGANGHVAFLKGLPRYSQALDILKVATTQDINVTNMGIIARAYVAALKRGGYFTGDEVSYGNGVASIATGYLGMPWAILDQNPYAVVPPGTPHNLDPEAFGIAWYPIRDIETAYGMIFEADWRNADKLHLATMLSCRYDCEGV